MPAPSADAAARSVPTERGLDPAREPVGLELTGVLLSLVGLLFGSALVTLAPEGTERPFANVVGPMGRLLAERLTLALGAGAYLFAAIPVAWGVACIRGRPPERWVRRALVVPLLAALTAILASLLLRRMSVPGLYRSGPGGYLGLAFHQMLFGAMGRGAGLLVAGLWVAALMFVTDFRLRAAFARLVRPAGAAAGGAEFTVADEDRAVAVLDEPEAATEPKDEEPAPPPEEPEEDEEEEEEAEADDDRGSPPEDSGEVAAPRPPRKKAKPRAPRPRRPAGEYVFPPTTLLEPGVPVDQDKVRAEVERNAAILATTLRSFGIEAKVVSQRRGPVITFYELDLEAGTRVNRITTLDKDLAVQLKAESVRIVAPIPGKNTVGVEAPNTIRDSVRLTDLLEEAGDRAGGRAIPLFLGKDGMGEPIVEDLAEMPHMLIAGATGSGKSVCVNSILLSVLLTRTPEEVKLVLIDPKQVELSFFEGIPHLLTPVVTNMKKASQILEWAVAKMEKRYDVFLKSGVRNIAGYNALGAARIAELRASGAVDPEDAPDLMPYLVLVVDELADLMLQHGKDVETAIIRLAAKSRAVGIHLILATQRPSVDVITGLIKSNMPMRVAFKVASMIDSRVILDHKGAEKLLGRGDMLYIPPRTSNLRRAQGTYVSDAEVKGVVQFVKERAGPVEYLDLLGESAEGLGDPMEEDDLYDDAVRAVLATKLGSASMLQRKFGIGYTRASRLIDMMCDHGVVGPHKGSKARELLVTLEEWEAAHAKEQAAPRPVLAPVDEGAGVPLGSSDEADGISDHGSGTKPGDVSSPWD
jgi:S-DNA-T family DNA segregation ATPase FtsK/SpoIIIE